MLIRRFTLAFLVCSTVNTLVICQTALANEPPPSGNADASSCSSLLLDRQVVQGTKDKFNPEDLSIFNSDVKPILELADQLPDFGDALRMALKKKWRFVYDDFKSCPTEYSMYTNPTHKVACQTPTEVQVNPDWYESIDDKSCREMTNANAIQALKQKQRDFFVHEMLLGVTLGTPISTAASSVIFNDLTLQPRPSAEKLQADLESSHFGIYKLGAHSSSHQEKAPAREISFDDVLRGQTVTIKATINGHGIYAGNWVPRGYNTIDLSAKIANQMCKKAGFSEALSASSEPLVSTDDDARGERREKVTLATYPDEGDGPIVDKQYPINVACAVDFSVRHDCHYLNAPRVLKTVVCKKNANANDVLGANDQMVPHSDADRRLASLSEKPSRAFQGSGSSQIESATKNESAM